MTDEIDWPGVVTSEDGVWTQQRENEYLHLEDRDEWDGLTVPHFYVFESDDLIDELGETIDELRNEYIFAQGIAFPDWMADEMPLEPAVFETLEWYITLTESLEPEDLEKIRETIDETDG